jgi:membrane protein
MTTGPRKPGDGADDAPAKGSVPAARYAQARERLDRSAVGHLQRRVVEVDLVNQAMILAALTFTLLIPVLVSLAALVPLGTADGISAVAAHRLGLSAAATRDLQQLFPTKDTVRGAATFFGTLLTVVSAFSWPKALQRGYELAWGLPSLGWRSLWGPPPWLATFATVGALSGGSAPLVTGWIQTVLLVVVGLPLAIGWAWWTQHLLLGGRVRWRLLLPGAVVTGVGLIGLRLFAGLYLSPSITEHFRHYGPLGIVFILWSWFVALSVVMLGGGVVSAALHELRLRRQSPA